MGRKIKRPGLCQCGEIGGLGFKRSKLGYFHYISNGTQNGKMVFHELIDYSIPDLDRLLVKIHGARYPIEPGRSGYAAACRTDISTILYDLGITMEQYEAAKEELRRRKREEIRPNFDNTIPTPTILDDFVVRLKLIEKEIAERDMVIAAASA